MPLLLFASLNEHLINEVTMVSRQEQARQRRERLLDAALQVFSEQGVDGASVKDIATAAGATPGLLYHYFDSKDALVWILLQERGFLPELRALLATASDRPAAEMLPVLLAAFDRLLTENRQLVTLFFTAGAANPAVRQQLHQLVTEGRTLLAGYLRARAPIDGLRAEAADTAAATALAAVAIGRTTGAGIDAVALADFLLHGLIASDGVEQP
jgi:AcrR family transcriptional regulator